MIAQTTYPFALPPLPYAYDALEPYVDEATMHFHHDKHLKTYVDNLNKALEAYPQYHSWTLETLLTKLEELPDGLRTAVRNNGGGVYNHDLFFDLMAPAGQKISPAVAERFGGEEAWQKEMKAAALGQFGSGFAWLVADSSGDLHIIISYILILLRFFLDLQGFSGFGFSATTPFLRHFRIEFYVRKPF